MDKKDIMRFGSDLRFISGIYNYCDRWCERCSFTSRCLTYAMTEKIEKELTDKDNDNRLFWEEINEMFEQTSEILIEIAEEQGIDLNSEDYYPESAELDDPFKAIEDNHLHRGAHEYIRKVNKLLDREGALFSQKPDAIEIIRWYQYLISAKIARAVSNDRISDDELEDTTNARDADGSIKVALIGIDRSIGAWGMLSKGFPDKKEEIMDVVLCLDRLCRKTEQEFPSARAFVRPGFDTLN